MRNFTQDYHFVLVLFIMISKTTIVHCATKNESASKILSERLTNNYGSTSIRPVLNTSETVVLFFRILISQVIQFDERKQHVELNAWRRQDWRDEFLQWDPADYGGIESITYSNKDIRKPDITLIENVGMDFIQEFDADVILNYDGRVTWFSPIIMTSSCMVEVRFFPFDVQTCTLTWMSWAYDSSGIDLHLSRDNDSNQDVFLQNGVWAVRHVVAWEANRTFECCDDPYSQIVYNLTLERAYGFYVLNIVLPSGLLAFVNCLVFLLPPESGERLQFAVSNLLAAILFQQLIGGIMPPLGDELPLLGMFFVYMILTNCFVLAMSIFILRFYHQRGDKGVPKFLRQLCLIRRDNEKSLRRHSNLKNSVFSVDEPRSNILGETNLDSESKSTPRKCESLVSRNNSHNADTFEMRRESSSQPSSQWERTLVSTRSLLERNRSEWQQVAHTLDKYLFFFIVSITVIVVITIVILFCTR